MDLLLTKIAVLTLLGVIRLVCGLLPLKITKRLQLWGDQQAASHLLVQRRRLQVERAISLCLCFGGGVLLATCFIHMLPEARESLEAARRAPGGLLPRDSSFPFAEFFVCLGFFLVFVIEEVAHRAFLHRADANASDALVLAHSHGDGASPKAPVSAPAVPEKLPPASPVTAVSSDAPVPVPVPVPMPVPVPVPTAVASAPPQCCATVETELHKMEMGGGDAEKGPAWSRPRSTSKIAPATSQVHLLASTLSLEQKDPNGLPIATAVHHHHHHVHHLGHHHHHHPHHHHHHHLPAGGEKTVMGHLRSVLVVLALSFHSVFEGLAIGLQPTQRDVWYLFAAVSVHASAILFCVGLELVMSGMRVLTLLAYVVVLALVSPLGVALGVAVTCVGGGGGGSDGSDAGAASSPTQTLVVGALQGIAGGTILYITFFEVLDREKRRADSGGALRLTCVLAGFAVMVVLQLLGGHDHGGEDSHALGAGNASHAQALHQHGA